jgi:predicted CoA-binding protein
MSLTAPDDIRALLRETRTIALVGASDRPDRQALA